MLDLINYRYIGIRGTYEELQIGETLGTSYLWNHEYDCSSYDTDEPIELGGVCAVDVLLNGSNIEKYDWHYVDSKEERIEMLEDLNDQINEAIEFAKNEYCFGNFYIVASEESTDEYLSDDPREIHLVDAIVIKKV